MLVFKIAKALKQKIIDIDKGNINVYKVVIFDLIPYNIVVVEGLRRISDIVLEFAFVKKNLGHEGREIIYMTYIH